jgi:hypothetical protein
MASVAPGALGSEGSWGSNIIIAAFGLFFLVLSISCLLFSFFLVMTVFFYLIFTALSIILFGFSNL